MRVERDLLHHPKLRKLEAISGNPAAIKWLIGLWGYCEKARAWRFDDMPPERLADACLAIIEGEELLTFLLASRFVKMEGKTLVVHKWDHWNAGYIQRWGAWKIGQSKHSADTRPNNARSSTDNRPRARLNERKKEEGPLAGKEEGRKPSLKLLSEGSASPDPGAVKKFGRLLGGLADSLRADKAGS